MCNPLEGEGAERVSTARADAILEGYLDRLTVQLRGVVAEDEIAATRAEVREHVRQLAEACEAGASPMEAMSAALARFGNADAIGAEMRRDELAMGRRRAAARMVGVPAALLLAGFAGYWAVEVSIYTLGRLTRVDFVADVSMDVVGLVLAEIVAVLAWRRGLGVVGSATAGALVFGLAVSLCFRFLLDHDLGVAAWRSGQGEFDWLCIGLAAAGGALAGGVAGAALRAVGRLVREPRRVGAR